VIDAQGVGLSVCAVALSNESLGAASRSVAYTENDRVVVRARHLIAQRDGAFATDRDALLASTQTGFCEQQRESDRKLRCRLPVPESVRTATAHQLAAGEPQETLFGR
jgi:hypothetical protein